MIAVVRNGVCEIHNQFGHRLVTLPPVNMFCKASTLPLSYVTAIVNCTSPQVNAFALTP